MNVCALDVVARTPDFESLASSLELRGWEWDLLHAADGTSDLGTIARQLGIDNDSAISFVHEAIHRGLLGVATMSLTAYRMRAPQAALASPPQKPVLGTTAVAAPALEAPVPEPQKPGAISFSVNSFDWNDPAETFEESEDEAAPAASAVPGKTVTAHVGGVHYDERFGVEHPDGPFASAREAAVEPAVPEPIAVEPVAVEPVAAAAAEPIAVEPVAVEPVETIAHDADVRDSAVHDEPAHPSVPKTGIAAVAATVAGVSAAAFGSVIDAVTPKDKPAEEAAVPAAEPPLSKIAFADEPVAETAADVPVEEPFAQTRIEEVPHLDTHAAEAFAAPAEPVEDPFAPQPVTIDEPFAAAAPHDEPFAEAAASDASFAPVDDPFAPKTSAYETFEKPPVFAEAPVAEMSHVDDPFAAKPVAVEDPFAAKPPEHEPFAASSHAVEDPFAPKAAAPEDEPFAAAATHDVDPFAPVTHHDEPFASATHDDEEPFVSAAHEEHEPLVAPAYHAEPIAEASLHDEAPAAETASSAPIAMSIGEFDTFEPIERHDEPVSSNGRAAAHEEPGEDSAPGSISFSFGDDSFDTHETHEAHDAPEDTHAEAYEPYQAPVASAKPLFEEPAAPVAAAPEPVFPQATTIEHHEDEKPAKTLGETQSTYFEREAIDTDAARDMDQKAKTWKESLSWREQQELNEAMETGKEKSGVIGSLLRALGVR